MKTISMMAVAEAIRIFCGFFHRDPSSGKAGTATEDIDHTSRTLLPVI